ncbi:MAG: glycosyltransferase family 9 protein [Dyella sp.]
MAKNRSFLLIRIDDLRRAVADRLTRLLLGKPTQPSTQPLPGSGVYRIVVCHLSHSLGNALLLTPLLQELERTYPEAEVDILTRSPVAQEIYGHYFNVRRLLRMPAHMVGHPLRTLSVLRALRRTRYDLAIDPDPQSQTSRLLLQRVNADCKLGFSSRRKSGHVTHSVALPERLKSKGQLPVYLLRQALHGNTSGDDLANPYPVPDIRLSDAELAQGRQALRRLLELRGTQPLKSGVMGIFANATGPKLLAPEWWNAFMRALEPISPYYQIVEIVPASGQSMLGSHYPAYYSSDIRKLGSVLANLTTYISLDCGVMHLACATQVPTLGIFTVTNTAEWGPYGRNDRIVHASERAPEDVAREILSLCAHAGRQAA